MNLQALASEFRVGENRIKLLIKALENLGCAVTESVLREAIALMVERNKESLETIAKLYVSQQSVKQVKQNPDNMNDAQFGIFEGLAGVQQASYNKSIELFRSAVDNGQAEAMRDAFIDGARGKYIFDPNSSTNKVFRGFLGFDIGSVQTPDEVDFAQLAIHEGAKRELPFSSVRSLTASKEPDQTETQTPDYPQTATESQPVEV